MMGGEKERGRILKLIYGWFGFTFVICTSLSTYMNIDKSLRILGRIMDISLDDRIMMGIYIKIGMGLLGGSIGA